MLDAARLSMRQLAELLSLTVDRPVVDRTGLTGLFRLRIELPPAVYNIGILPNTDSALANEPSAASAFKAVEGLGLKLEPRRVPLDVLVVDAIERVPTEN